MKILNPKETGQRIKKLFVLDLRSLALLRIGLGSVIILDLIQRFPYIEAFYSDRGFFPKAFYVNYTYNSSLAYSFHSLGTSPNFFAVLFLLEAVIALLLLLGWHTRIVTILSWVFLTSLDNRNSLILNNGDLQLRLLLFWGIFLPLGQKFSIDSLKRVSFPRQFSGLPSAAYYLQIFCIYFFAGIHKIVSPVWQQGNGVLSALSMQTLATPFAVFLKSYPDLLRPANFAVISVELIAPLFLLLSPSPKIKSLAISLLIIMNLWFFLSFSLGLFPFIGILGLIALLPGSFWDLKLIKKFTGHLNNRANANITEKVADPRLKPALNILVGLLVFTFLWVNLWSVKLTGGFLPQIISLSRTIQIYQSWGMFSSFPNDDSGYYSVQGRLNNSGVIDLAISQPWQKFASPYYSPAYFADSRWANYFLHYLKNPWHGNHFARYQCNRSRSQDITSIKHIEISYILDWKTTRITDLRCQP